MKIAIFGKTIAPENETYVKILQQAVVEIRNEGDERERKSEKGNYTSHLSVLNLRLSDAVLN